MPASVEHNTAKPSLLKWVMARLKRAPDREYEMVINRLVIAVLLLSYLLVTHMFEDHEASAALWLTVAFACTAIMFFVHVLIKPRLSVGRRLLMIFNDIGALSYCLHIGGEITSLLYPLYLWTIFGNGFRFGIKYLVIATVCSLAGFALATSYTTYWSEQYRLTYGLLAALIVLPAYAATLIKKLSAARQEAEEASHAKSMFLASVSHELRTPLNAIIGMSELLRGTQLDSEQRDMARTISGSGKSLLALINNILEYSRIQAGQMPRHDEDFDLFRLLNDVRNMVTVQASSKGLGVNIFATPATPYWLRGDARHLQEILLNLTANAVKFTEKGSVTLAVNGTQQGNRVALRVEISDTGIGIAPTAQSLIFERFRQADETIINRFGGTGLGLAIVKQLVDSLGGRIGVDSTVGVGSTFWFELEFETAQSTPAQFVPAPFNVLLLSQRAPSAVPLVEQLTKFGANVNHIQSVDRVIDTLKQQMESRKQRCLVLVDSETHGHELDELNDWVRTSKLSQRIGRVLLIEDNGTTLPEEKVRHQTITLVPNDAGADEIEHAARLCLIAVGTPSVESDEDTSTAIQLQGNAQPSGITILVADDNLTNQKVIGKILQRAGHTVRFASNGEQALDMIGDNAVDLVFMDINMPVLDGVEATKIHRFASLGQERLPIIGLTADARPEARKRCLEAGMDACLSKPVEPAQLLQTIGKFVSKAPAAAAIVVAEENAKPTDHSNDLLAHQSSIDENKLADLRDLGGEQFTADVIEQFLHDAAQVLRSLRQAANARDAELFRDQVHALRSGAANVGASTIYKVCLEWRDIDTRELIESGQQHLSLLEQEYDKVRETLTQRLSTYRH